MDVAAIAGRYGEGIDIQFVQSHAEGQDLRSTDKVAKVFKRATKDGGNGERHRAWKKFEKILEEFVAHPEGPSASPGGGSERSVERGDEETTLNIVIVSDATPVEEYRKVIVALAKNLGRRNLHPPLHVGILFIQTIDDPKALSSLQSLDNSLLTEHDVRHMVHYISSTKGISADLIFGELLKGVKEQRLERVRRAVL
ncbi:hypothetical protein IAT38_006761 [Cryptococcus sp. DSM 104549]